MGVHLDDLPLEVPPHICRHLGLRDLVRVSQTCKRFRHGGLETVELPTESPVVTALRELAFFAPAGPKPAPQRLLRVVGGVPGPERAAALLPEGAADCVGLPTQFFR
jgi:hypothetical protein